MEIDFDANGWSILRDKVRDDVRELNRLTRENILASSNQARRMIKIRMPVDTGAAMASWGVPGEAGIWDVKDDGFAITQGSKLPYIEALNEGHSQQAPAGFIDVEHEKAIVLFVNNMVKDVKGHIGK